MTNYKVCILAAGVGSRMGAISDHVNKAILPVDYKAVISHIIEKFPEYIEIVIAVGHKKETIIDYLSLAHPERNITYVEIEKYVGPGTGPGLSLLKCKDNLKCPFVWVTADTIVLGDIPPVDKNWYGIAPVKDPENYCTVKIKNNLIYQFDDKIKVDNKYAGIGLAGIYDYEIFFDALEKDRKQIAGEIQTSNGFKKLIEKELLPTQFTWFDTGTLEKYKKANESFSGGHEKFDFSKGDEFIYFVNGRVIKFFANEQIVRNRFERAKSLKGLCPEIEDCKGNFYSYLKVDGHDLYNVITPSVLKDLLNWSKSVLWEKPDLSDQEEQEFYDACRRFYYDKTMKRLESFYLKNNIIDEENIINGVPVPSLKELFSKLDFEEIYKGVPVRFHGDFTVGNILVTRDMESHLNKFILLDWRQDFGGLTKVGDLYYDLAKLYKGIILSDELIKEGLFSFDMSGPNVYYDYYLKNKLIEAKEEFEYFIAKNEYDLKKIKTITAIALINMSPLHHEPFNFLVYFMGKNMLHKIISEKENKNQKNDEQDKIQVGFRPDEYRNN